MGRAESFEALVETSHEAAVTIYEILSSPVARGALEGLLAAAAVDIHAFVRAQGWHVDGFNVGVASKRWFTGAVTGAATALGLGYLL